MKAILNEIDKHPKTKALLSFFIMLSVGLTFFWSLITGMEATTVLYIVVAIAFICFLYFILKFLTFLMKSIWFLANQ